MSIPNFSDLVTRKALDGDSLKLDDIRGRAIIVTGMRISASKFKKKGDETCTTIQFYFEDDETQTKYVTFTGSSVIREQMEEISKKLEETGGEFMFRTTVEKCGKYYALT